MRNHDDFEENPKIANIETDTYYCLCIPGILAASTTSPAGYTLACYQLS